MSEFDLITAVQPDDGWIAIVGIKKGSFPQQELAKTRTGADNLIASYLREGRDVYFGVARFGDPANAPIDLKTGKRVERGQANATGLKAFWIDLDCGEGKPYADQGEAARALKAFCAATGLPRPTVVNSGGGLHVYWILTQAITPAEWEPVASKFRDLCFDKGLQVDRVVFETARILRVPGTYNFKLADPRPVEVLFHSPPVEFADFVALVGNPPPMAVTAGSRLAPSPPPAAVVGMGLSALGQQIADDRDCHFETIIRGRKCAQLVDCVVGRAELEEPRWRAALSIANRAIDREVAIRAVSEGHPDYDWDAADAKAGRTKGPYTCKQFENLNPGGCAGCAYANTVTSPVQLGKESPQEDDEDVGAEVDGSDFSPNWNKLPFPYFRHEDGGIWKRSKDDEGEGKPVLVYEYDLYVKDRMQNVEGSAHFIVWVRHPKDGTKTFTLPASDMTEPRALKAALASRSIIASHRKGWDELMAYLLTSSKKLVDKRRAKQMRSQFGWADNNSKFIVGNSEISVDGTHYSPASGDMQAMAELMEPAGTLDKWKEVANLYGEVGLEPHAFAMLTAFGAPLLTFSGQSGAMINLIHRTSGTGKTTALNMANSVWGHPKLLNSTEKDTENTKVHKMGMRGTMHICFDEMTNVEPYVLSNLIYQASQGTGKDRMMASSNQLRVNTTKWCTIVLCSSNASFYAKLNVAKVAPEGEIMRLVEYEIEPSTVLDPAFAKEMFDTQLLENYGHAGLIYARFLVENLELVQDQFKKIQGQIDRVLKLLPSERYWSALIAANLTGGHFAKHLGLIDWDVPRVGRWAMTLIKNLRDTTTPPQEPAKAVLSTFMANNIQSMLVVNAKVDLRSSSMKMQQAPTVTPTHKLLIRYEPDTRRVFIDAAAFREECDRRQIDPKAVRKELMKDGVLLGSMTKAMSKGMLVSLPPTNVWEFDADHPTFSLPDVPETEAEEDPDAGSGS